MSLVNRKSIIHISVGVSLSNPNGNIDNGEPRRTFNDCGLISPMSIKRKIRDLLEDQNSPVTQEFIRKFSLDPNACCIFESRNRGFTGNNTEKENFKKAMDLFKTSEADALARYIDIRWFGGTILEENKSKEEKSSKSEKSVRFTRRGTVQVDMLSSIRPIETVIGGITRKASTQEKNQEGEDRDNSAGSMGQGAIRVVRNAIYCGNIRISPFDAHKTNTSESDITLLKGLIPYIFAINSAQRSGVEVMQAVCMDHPDSLGVLNDSIFTEACRPRTRPEFSSSSPSESFAEYEIPTLVEIKAVINKHKNGSKVTITDLLA